MKKRIMTIALALCLLAVAAMGTIAYFTDSAYNANTMTYGSVDIEQWEYQRATNEDGTYQTKTIDNVTSYVLEGYKQDKPILPIVGDPHTGEAGWDDTTVRMTQVDSYGGMNVFAGKTAQDKFVVVKNVGNSDAYVRTLVAIEVGTGNAGLVGTSYHQTWKDAGTIAAQIDGKNYSVTEYVYAGGKLSDGSWRHENGALTAGETAYPVLSQIYLAAATTNDDVKALDADGDGKLDVFVLSQAVQVEGFEAAGEKPAAEVALDKAFGDVTAENVAEWFK